MYADKPTRQRQRPKPETDILTAICPIAILLYMKITCCQDT